MRREPVSTTIYNYTCSVVHYKLIKWAQSNLLSCFNVMFSTKMYVSASQNYVWAFPVISGMCTEQSPFVLDLLSRWCQCEDISLCGRKNVLEVCPMSIAHARWENPRFGRFESGRVFQLDGGTARPLGGKNILINAEYSKINKNGIWVLYVSLITNYQTRHPVFTLCPIQMLISIIDFRPTYSLMVIHPSKIKV